jgi:Flp pilus assembly protein protease CpaA
MALSGTDTGNVVDVARIVLALCALAFASWTDLRTRKVPNGLWYVTAGVAAVILLFDLAQVEDGNIWYLALAFPVIALFAVVVTGGELWPVMSDDEDDPDRELTREESRVYIIDLVLSAILLVVAVAILVLAHGHLDNRDPYWAVVSSMLMIALALGLYIGRFLHGGGDAKALMTLAVVFPIIPFGEPFLWAIGAEADALFPFSLAILVNAAIITALLPIFFLVVSNLRGPVRMPEAFFGYPVDISAFDEKRMWLLYELPEEGGALSRRLWPRRSKAAIAARARALAQLKDSQEPRVYITPKIPFMVPMLIAIPFSLVVGNIILGLMVWITKM